MSDTEKLSNFGDQAVPVSLIETMTIKEGVECDTYAFNDDRSKDLAVVRVAGGAKTPLQLIVSGVTTTEGFISGKGTLSIKSYDGEVTNLDFDEQNPGEVLVEVGQTMQWTADPDSELIFYEVCVPPYQEGRFENLTE